MDRPVCRATDSRTEGRRRRPPHGAALLLGLLLAAGVAGSCAVPDDGAPDGAAPEAIDTAAPGADVDSPPDLPSVRDRGEAGGAPPDSGAPPLLESVAPLRGTTAGGEVVSLFGQGFTNDCTAQFGVAPPVATYVVAAGHLTAVTPPGEPGAVAVALACGDHPPSVLPAGFTYVAPLAVVAVLPEVGPTAGGTPLTVRGVGFDATTRVLVGDRLAVAPTVTAPTELQAMTPPGPAGRVPVTVLRGADSATRPRAFRYVAPPTVGRMEPVVGPAAGGTAVRVTGRDLGDVADVAFGAAPGVLAEVAPDRLVVATPPAPAGSAAATGAGPTAVPVTFVTAFGDVVRQPGFVYRPDAAPGDPPQPLAVAGVVPDHGTLAGGEDVTVVLAEAFAAADPVAVTFAGRPAPLRRADAPAGILVVATPPGDAPGPVTVAVTVGAATASLPAGFRYDPPLGLHAVRPAAGPAFGGTTIDVDGAGFGPPGPAEDTVLFVGGLPARDLRVVADDRLRAVTPPGSPGPADLHLRMGERTATLTGAFHYDAPLELFAVVPAVGDVGGGMVATLVGTGFAPGAAVHFGAAPALLAAFVDSTALTVFVPAHAAPGVVDVTVALPDGATARRDDAFRYERTAVGNGGTAGPPIDGVLHVTVVASRSGFPVRDAYVILGENPATPHQGTTDASGTVTFSGPDLTGPQRVSASAPCHSRASVIAFDASNVTLPLAYTCPTDGGGGGDGGGRGRIEGRILDYDKAVPIPVGECIPDPALPTVCLGCVTDAQCLPDITRCADVPEFGDVCLFACDDGPSVCPEGTLCRETRDLRPHCIPMGGERVATCLPTRESMFASLDPPPGDGAVVDADGRYGVDARFGEQAIVCVAGVRLWTGTFVPQRLGVRRFVAPTPDRALVTGADVPLDVPLTGSLEVRLAHDVLADFGLEWILYDVFLDLGSGGLYRFDARGVSFPGDAGVVVTTLPAVLDGPLADATYSVLATARGPNDPSGLQQVSRAVALRQRGPVTVGPFLDPPRFSAFPTAAAPRLAWRVAPERRAADLQTLAVTERRDGFETLVWQLFLAPDVREVVFPDFVAIAATPGLPRGRLRVALTRLEGSGRDIDGFDLSVLSPANFRAWAVREAEFEW